MHGKAAHPNCLIIAGSNGAGKTTFATEFLPIYANCRNFINSDLIACPCSPSVSADVRRLILKSPNSEVRTANLIRASLHRLLRIQENHFSIQHLAFSLVPMP